MRLDRFKTVLENTFNRAFSDDIRVFCLGLGVQYNGCQLSGDFEQFDSSLIFHEGSPVRLIGMQIGCLRDHFSPMEWPLTPTPVMA